MKKIIIIVCIFVIIVGGGIFFYLKLKGGSDNTSSNKQTIFTSKFVCDNLESGWGNTPCTYNQELLSDENLNIMARGVWEELIAANQDMDLYNIGNVIFSYQTDFGLIYQFGCDEDVSLNGLPGISSVMATVCIFKSDYYYFYNSNGSRISVCGTSIDPKICSWLLSLKNEKDRARVDWRIEDEFINNLPLLSEVDDEYTLINTEKGVFKVGKSVSIPDNFPKDIYLDDGQIKYFIEDYLIGKYSIRIETTQSIEQLKQSYETELENNGWVVNAGISSKGTNMEIEAYKKAQTNIGITRNIYTRVDQDNTDNNIKRIFMTIY